MMRLLADDPAGGRTGVCSRSWRMTLTWYSTKDTPSITQKAFGWTWLVVKYSAVAVCAGIWWCSEKAPCLTSSSLGSCLDNASPLSIHRESDTIRSLPPTSVSTSVCVDLSTLQDRFSCTILKNRQTFSFCEMCQNSFELHHNLRIPIILLSRVSVLSKLVCNHALPDCSLILKRRTRHCFKMRFNADHTDLNLLCPLVELGVIVLEHSRFAKILDVHQSYSRPF